MGKIESGIGLISRLVTEGPVALISIVMEKIGDLKDRVLGAITSFIKEKIIMGGIMWLMGLLNPAAAFVKAVKTIIDIVRFFVDKGKQIWDFVTTVVDSFGQIANGSLGGAAAAIERVLAKLLPVLIGFLASLLGLGGIGEKVKEIIGSIRKPINKIIDGVVKKAVKFGKKLLKSPLGRKLTGGVKKAKAWAKKKVDAAKAKGRAVVEKVKGKIYGGTPEEREAKGLAAGVRAVRRFSGQRVGRAVIAPALALIKARRGLSTLRVNPVAGFWHVEAVARSTANSGVPNDGTAPHTTSDGSKPGHASNIGGTGAYSSMSGRQDQRKAQHPSLALIAEHIVPRGFVDQVTRAMSIGGATRTGSFDNEMHTILIYEGAADIKTRGETALAAPLARAVRDLKREAMAEQRGVEHPPGARGNAVRERTLELVLSRLLAPMVRERGTKTSSSVSEDNRGTGGNARGTVSDQKPTSSQIGRALARQYAQIRRHLRGLVAQTNASIGSRLGAVYDHNELLKPIQDGHGGDFRGEHTLVVPLGQSGGSASRGTGTIRTTPDQSNPSTGTWTFTLPGRSRFLNPGAQIGSGSYGQRGAQGPIVRLIRRVRNGDFDDPNATDGPRFTETDRAWAAHKIRQHQAQGGTYQAAAEMVRRHSGWDGNPPSVETLTAWERERRS